MEKRQVKFSTLIDLMKSRGPIAILGIIFTLISVVILFPAMVILNLVSQDPYENYDFKSIEKSGTEMPAKISGITIVYNQTYNGYHPQIISYTYQQNGTAVSDKFETIDDISALNIGDDIAIKVLNGESKIKGMKPFSFPFYIFFMIPAVFFVLGVVFFIVTLIPALKNYKLYKSGIVKEATIVEINKPFTSVVMPRQGLMVNYYYTGIHGEKIFGSSRTDMSILIGKSINEKIKILVSEDDETQSCIVPKLESLKNNWGI